jgi:hypothetical protein
MKKEMTTMRVSKENHAEILKIVGLLQNKSGKPTAVDDAIEALLSNYYKKNIKAT